MKRTHTNWPDNSKHSLWLIRRKKLHIDVSLGELFLFVAYWTMIPIFFPQVKIFLLIRSRFFISIEWQVCITHALSLFFGLIPQILTLLCGLLPLRLSLSPCLLPSPPPPRFLSALLALCVYGSGADATCFLTLILI